MWLNSIRKDLRYSGEEIKMKGFGRLFGRKDTPKEDTKVNNDIIKSKETEAALKTIEGIENVMMKAAGSVAPIFMQGHEKIDALCNKSNTIKEEIKEDFNKDQIDAVHLTWIITITGLHLRFIDGLILIEIQHPDSHKQGFEVILTFLESAHQLVTEPEQYGKELLGSNSKKIMHIAPKVVEYFNEYHKTLFLIKNSVENSIKFEVENKMDKLKQVWTRKKIKRCGH